MRHVIPGLSDAAGRFYQAAQEEIRKMSQRRGARTRTGPGQSGGLEGPRSARIAHPIARELSADAPRGDARCSAQRSADFSSASAPSVRDRVEQECARTTGRYCSWLNGRERQATPERVRKGNFFFRAFDGCSSVAIQSGGTPRCALGAWASGAGDLARRVDQHVSGGSSLPPSSARSTARRALHRSTRRKNHRSRG